MNKQTVGDVLEKLDELKKLRVKILDGDELSKEDCEEAADLLCEYEEMLKSMKVSVG